MYSIYRQGKDWHSIKAERPVSFSSSQARRSDLSQPFEEGDRIADMCYTVYSPEFRPPRLLPNRLLSRLPAT